MPEAGQSIRRSDLEIIGFLSIGVNEYDFHGGFGVLHCAAPFNSYIYLLGMDTDHYACHEIIILVSFAVIKVKKT